MLPPFRTRQTCSGRPGTGEPEAASSVAVAAASAAAASCSSGLLAAVGAARPAQSGGPCGSWSWQRWPTPRCWPGCSPAAAAVAAAAVAGAEAVVAGPPQTVEEHTVRELQKRTLVHAFKRHKRQNAKQTNNVINQKLGRKICRWPRHQIDDTPISKTQDSKKLIKPRSHAC